MDVSCRHFRRYSTYRTVQQEVHQWSDRRKVVERVLLPMMIFVHVDLYEQKEDFRELIDKKRYVYADGHVCLNTPSIVRQENKRGAVLTDKEGETVLVCISRFVYADLLLGFG